MVTRDGTNTSLFGSAFPIRIVATTSFACGSIRERVPAPALGTQTAPSPIANRCGNRPTLIVVTSFPARTVPESSETDVSVAASDVAVGRAGGGVGGILVDDFAGMGAVHPMTSNKISATFVR